MSLKLKFSNNDKVEFDRWNLKDILNEMRLDYDPDLEESERQTDGKLEHTKNVASGSS